MIKTILFITAWTILFFIDYSLSEQPNPNFNTNTFETSDVMFS